jgi:hypothetical protein
MAEEPVTTKLEKNQSPQGTVIPPEMSNKVREILPEAAKINDILDIFKDKGDIAIIALMSQPMMRFFFQSYLNQVLPHLAVEISRRDRDQIYQVMVQTTENRIEKATLKKEPIDPKTYKQAVEDYKMVSSQVPSPNVNMQIVAPILTESPSNPVQIEVLTPNVTNPSD